MLTVNRIYSHVIGGLVILATICFGYFDNLAYSQEATLPDKVKIIPLPVNQKIKAINTVSSSQEKTAANPLAMEIVERLREIKQTYDRQLSTTGITNGLWRHSLTQKKENLRI